MPLHRVANIASPIQSDSDANRLILGNNLAAMDALLPTMRGAFRILYADPPFATGHTFTRRIGRDEDSRQPDQWKRSDGFSDSWNTLEEYLGMLYSRLARMHDLLAEDGTIFLHLDWHAAPYARMLLDEIFGPEQFLNEIIWLYHGPSPVRAYFNRKHDTILVYSKGDAPCYHPDRVRVPYHPQTIKTFASSAKAGFGKIPDLERGKIPEDWWYFPVVARLHSERTGYPTQKPEALLERIVRTASEPGDWVGDFFCGSGTTLRVADSLGRHWVGCDVNPSSIGVCQRRLGLGAASSSYALDVVNAEDAPCFLGEPCLRVACTIHGMSLEITLEDFPGCGPDGFPSSLDYWEADFAHNGSIFQGMAHSARPWRKGAAGTSLRHVFSETGPYRICARAISADGKIGCAFLEVRV
jgi:DNA modification methylase